MTAETKNKKKRPAESPRKPRKSPAVTASPKDKQVTKRKKTETHTATPNTTSTIHTVSSEVPGTHNRTLVIDNGGDTLKYGWHDDTAPQTMSNVTARLPQQWTVLAGDQLSSHIQNPHSLIHITRSTERGMVTNLGNQVQVWKRILDVMHIQSTSNDVPMMTVTPKASRTTQSNTSASTWIMHKASSCSVMVALAPHTPRTILDAIVRVWLEDFGFARVGLCCSPWMAAVTALPYCIAAPNDDTTTENSNNNNNRVIDNDSNIHDTGTTCVVDMGWSAIHIVPTYHFHQQQQQSREESESSQDAVPSSSTASVSLAASTTVSRTTHPLLVHLVDSRAIRRIPLGGRHLIHAWKYQATYRQWNLMDQEWILRQVMEQTAFVSLDFMESMKAALHQRPGHRPWDREFVLPDYQSTWEGRVQLPMALLQQNQEELIIDSNQVTNHPTDKNNNSDKDDDDESNSDVEEGVVKSKGHKGNVDDNEDDDEDDGDSEDETIEQKKKRLLKQRQEEERRKREAEADQQILNISVERFAIPEALFRPSDLGFPVDYAGLPEAIVQAIEACPPVCQPALYQSIRLVGGLAQLPNLVQRLERELRILAPSDMEVRIVLSDAPIEQAWRGACRIAKFQPCSQWSISARDCEASNKRGAYQSMLHSEGGYLV
jgi:actin-related protein